MSLEQIVDNTRTDKNTTHSHLPLYESLFKNKKETAQNILEIGIQNGGSIKLWRDYFINVTIYGLDTEQSAKDSVCVCVCVCVYYQIYTHIFTYIRINKA